MFQNGGGGGKYQQIEIAYFIELCVNTDKLT